MILTLLICCFLGFGALQPSCAAPSSNENNIVEVEKKDKHNLIDRFGYMIISPYEAFSRGELYSHFSSSFTDATVTGTRYSLPYVASDVWYVQWNRQNTNNPDNAVSNYGQLLNTCYYELNSVATDNGIRIQFWDLYLYFGNWNPIKYTIEILYNIYSTGTTMVGCNWIDMADRGGVYSVSYMLYCRSSSYLYQLYVDNADTYIYNTGYEAGYTASQQETYVNAYAQGDADGYQRGYTTGYNAGETTGYNAGEQNGYAQGLSDGQANSGVAQTIFAGCVEVGLLPVNVFLKMFEYEVFGINIAGFVSALMTIAIVIIIIRMVTGGKNDK